MWFPREHTFKEEHSISVPWLLFFWERLVKLLGEVLSAGITLKCTEVLNTH